MAKKELVPKAEEMYLKGAFSFKEIAEQLQLAEKTVRLWADAGGWREKRAALLEARRSLDTRLYELANNLMDSIERDYAEGAEVDPRRLDALTRIVDKIQAAHKYASTRKSEEKQAEQSDGLSDEALQKIEQSLKIL